MTQAEAARAVGVHRRTVNIWRRRHREQGEEGVLDGRRVSPRRGQGRLTGDEARRVRAWIGEGTPDRPELPFALWTSRAVRELIERRLAKRRMFGMSSVSSMIGWPMMVSMMSSSVTRPRQLPNSS